MMIDWARLLVALTAALLLPAAHAAGRAQAELACESTGSGPQLHCTVRLKQPGGAALKDARVSLGADMPSMPMAHSVPSVQALPTALPGEYRATLELEMTGDWAVQIDIAGPTRDRIVRVLRVECKDERRCPARPASSRSAAQRPPHKH